MADHHHDRGEVRGEKTEGHRDHATIVAMLVMEEQKATTTTTTIVVRFVVSVQ